VKARQRSDASSPEHSDRRERPRSGEGGRSRGFCGAVLYCGGTERGTALALAVVASATPLRAQRGDVAERPPAPWGFQVVPVRYHSRRHTPHHRSVTTALSWRADTRAAQVLAPSGDCSPDPPPFENSLAGAASNLAPYTPTGQHRDAISTSASAIPSCAGTHSVTSVAQRPQNAFHQSTMGIGPSVSPTLRTHRSAVLQLAASPALEHTRGPTSSPGRLPHAASVRLPT